MALGGEVDDGAGAMLFEQARYESGVADVALDEGVAGVVFDGGKVFGVSGVGQLVEVDDGAVARGQPVEHEV